MSLIHTAIVASILLNLLFLLFACIWWRKNRKARLEGGLFEVIVRRGVKSGYVVSDDACIELLLTGKLNEEATDFFRWAASECFARYSHDGCISRLYEVWFTPAFDDYRLHSDKTPACLHANLTNRHIRQSDVHDLGSKAPGEVPASKVDVNPSGGNLDARPMSANVDKQVGET